ncbi:MerR family transcriptional regulator [Gordonia liuliyuniae]|uniref:MerR family transcriptional regulator n=1 Tax=Gordonia liuliyuniae TaxID=2911517 RepID=A0ABS9IPJ1_9ACTN|nr:MerR family transcriptional regulator [Gordonia liuliyuniae]MCF8587455.1 MerR family transcriptional regulator [Gordonia liuliyuniae]
MTEYRIDDLAQAAGTTTRNVRGYQDRGLIPRPERRGRIAIYGDEHLSRLHVINDLLGRGFTMTHIAEFFERMEQGEDLAEVLGLRELVTAPWSRTPSETVSVEELYELLGTDDAGLLERMRASGLIEPIGDDALPEKYTITDTESIDGYVRLMANGMPLSYVLDLQEKLDEDMQRAAHTLVSAGRSAITEGRFDGWIPEVGEESEWASDFLSELRRTGRVTAHNTLYRALDRELSRQLDDYLAVARGRKHHRD